MHTEQGPPFKHDQHASLRRTLRARYGHQPFVPGEVDEAVLAAARSHLGSVRRRQRMRRLAMAGGSLAAAAAVAVSAWLVQPWTPAPAPSAVTLPGDVNGDGVVDVLDMLVLARTLEAGDTPPAHADVTGDGQVTRADIEAIGRHIVRLHPQESNS